MSTVQPMLELLKATYTSWDRHNATRLGAALAYYALLSMSPLLILLVAICGLVFHGDRAERQVLQQTETAIGPGAAAAFRGLLANAHHRGTGVLATAIALLTLFFGASGVFLELKSSLNTIWDAPAQISSGLAGFLRQRLLSFAMIVGLGAFLLASFAISTGFAVAERFAADLVPVPAAIAGEAVNILVLLTTFSLLFAAIFKWVPNVPVGWRDVLTGAVATALLFVLGKTVLALYLTTAAVGSAYGAAGSLVAVVVWVYYSAQIFFFGAEFTHIYAERSHSVGKLAPALR